MLCYTTKYPPPVLPPTSPLLLLLHRLLGRDIVIHYSILQHHEFPWDDILIVCYTATTAAAGSQPLLYAAGGGGSNTRIEGVPSRYNSMCNVWTLLECLMKSCLISNNGLEPFLRSYLNPRYKPASPRLHLPFRLFFYPSSVAVPSTSPFSVPMISSKPWPVFFFINRLLSVSFRDRENLISSQRGIPFIEWHKKPSLRCLPGLLMPTC